MISGIDVSNYQSSTYSLTGFDFVFVKATEGTSYVNPKHAAQVARARNNNRVVGHYHYLNSNSTMTAQMDYFLAQASPEPGEILAVDWEESAVSSAEKDQALKYLISKAGGRRVLLYCSQSYWVDRDTSSYAGDGLWIAQYNGKPGSPSIQASWVMHQYTSDPIDTSVAAFGSRDEMAAWAAGEDADVALTDAEITKIATKVIQIDGLIKSDSGSTTNPYVSLGTVTRNAAVVSRRVESAVTALQTTVENLAPGLTDAQVTALAGALAGNSGLVDRIAEAVAEKLAARLAD